jgi:hypothetical protein
MYYILDNIAESFSVNQNPQSYSTNISHCYLCAWTEEMSVYVKEWFFQVYLTPYKCKHLKSCETLKPPNLRFDGFFLLSG